MKKSDGQGEEDSLMRYAKWTTSPARLTALARRAGLHTRLFMVLGLAIIAVGSIAATTSQPVSAVIQTKRLEIVNDEGKVVFAAYATAQGGRVEVVDNAGHTVFSVGTAQDGQELPGSWERMRLEVDQKGQDINRQRQALNALTRRVRDMERQQQNLRREPRQEPEVDRRLRDLEQQSRAVDALERQLRQLSRQLNALERR